ncbi:putative RNA methyltransferase [Thauera linaloolentis]|uniref:rRNA (Guanine-N(1)-)-methyltransferase n=1 Tax=Thauera linaloolentis (strain DSM 12138 / JCM 21573 / CCUG 41526 / CIP 105981 / IAM 15112 / NBRC 102519 / 47Lol) TaxID=1123367 RepID=N6Y1C8_THAL4|nr:methyltransferase domain-containing protein [Thauera linaloolentis]ENO87971.1 rRNA (guanine-N(1)-)-methyltransferase [Thauera linaloolentis 47Lol = DSM 12138]MCM8567092.1 methyltransferase domain-containing protein [Thauera linaloolentis]
MIVPFQTLACPLDAAPLWRDGAHWRCPAGHCFDIAREGYINLLPVQYKRSRDPGDSKEMVGARRRFLDAGHYQPIADAVSRIVLAGLPPQGGASCLDAGCGEGYYLRRLAAAVHPSLRMALAGLDISKWAVRAAAKRQGEAAWLVGSNARLPVADAALDRVLCMFGFPVHAEFARVLKPGGLLLQVDAGPDHLRELREIIYPALKPERDAAPVLPAGFDAEASDSLRFTLELEGAEAIADLLLMTPHLFRATPEGRARAAALSRLSLTADVKLLSLVRG